jgi:hypothetical protein
MFLADYFIIQQVAPQNVMLEVPLIGGVNEMSY